MKEKSANKPAPLGSEWETRAGHPSILVAGVDEVGRGCLAGPVVAAAVIPARRIDFFADPWLAEINDSKALKADTRSELAPKIQSWAQAAAIGVASVEEIDELNIYHASHLAMKRAIENLGLRIKHALIDGNAIPKGLSCGATAIVRGDARCLSIAAASILAKVWRDRTMQELDSEFPGYGFAEHKGYPTPQHAAALQRHGVTKIHRRSFAPVAELLSLPPAVS